MNINSYPDHVVENSLAWCARAGLRNAHPSRNPIVPGTDLCTVCHSRFARSLQELVQLWFTLQTAHVRRPQRSYKSDRVSGGGGVADAGAMWNPGARVAIAEITDWYEYVVRTIRGQRPVEWAPDQVGPLDAYMTAKRARGALVTDWHLPEDVPSGLIAIAHTHARWLSGYPTVGPSLLADVLRMLELTHRALDQPSVQKITMRGMFCTEIVTDTEWGTERCNAELAGIIPAGDRVENGPAVILCTANPRHHQLTKTEWILQTETPFWITIDVAATALGLSAPQTNAIALRDNWTRRPALGTRAFEYYGPDIQTTHRNRKATP